LIVRRTGALHDPEVKPTVATFRDLRTTHTRRIKNMRAVSNSTSSLNVPSGLAQSAARRRSSRRMSSDAMTQLAISRPQRLITAFRIATFVIRRLHGSAVGGVKSFRSRSPICERLHSSWARARRKTSHRRVVATRPDSVLADALKHLVIACKNNGWLVAGTSSARSGSVLL